MVSRLLPSAVRAASSTAAAMAKPSKATSAIASHCSDWIAPNTGLSQLDCASTRAAGATSRSDARSAARRAGVTAPVIRASISAGTGMASPSAVPAPSQGSISASTSACGTCRTDTTPGAARSRPMLAVAWRARASVPASTICTVIPRESSASVATAVLRSESPAAAAITVSATMIAITQGIGPARRGSGTSRASLLPDWSRQPPIRRNPAGLEPDCAADTAARR